MGRYIMNHFARKMEEEKLLKDKRAENLLLAYSEDIRIYTLKRMKKLLQDLNRLRKPTE